MCQVIIADENPLGEPRVVWTELRSSATYSKVYSLYMDIIMRIILPATVMVYTNIR